MNTQFKKGVVELCVLKLISVNDMSSVSVIETISAYIEVSENTIYPILRRLTKQGLFDTYKEPVEIGAPRKYYQLTKEGKTQLNELEKLWSEFLDSIKSILSIESKEDIKR